MSQEKKYNYFQRRRQEVSNSIYQNAVNKYAPRRFKDEWLETVLTLKEARPVLQAFSAFFAAMAFSIIVDGLPFWASFVMGLLFATLFELVKDWTSGKAFYLKYKNNKRIYLGAVFLFGLASIFISEYGAYEAFLEYRDKREVSAEAKGMRLLSQAKQEAKMEADSLRLQKMAYLDSLSTVLTGRVGYQSREAEDFYKKNTVTVVRGGKKTEVLRIKATDVYNRLASRKDSLQASVQSELSKEAARWDEMIAEVEDAGREIVDSARDKKNQIMSESEDSAWVYLVLVGILTFIVEGGIIASKWFPEYYEYRVSMEALDLGEVEVQEYYSPVITNHAMPAVSASVPTAPGFTQRNPGVSSKKQGSGIPPFTGIPDGYCFNCRAKLSGKQEKYCSPDCNREYSLNIPRKQ